MMITIVIFVSWWSREADVNVCVYDFYVFLRFYDLFHQIPLSKSNQSGHQISELEWTMKWLSLSLSLSLSLFRTGLTLFVLFSALIIGNKAIPSSISSSYHRNDHTHSLSINFIHQTSGYHLSSLSFWTGMNNRQENGVLNCSTCGCFVEKKWR